MQKTNLIMDIKMEIDSDGVCDFVFDNGGLLTDETMKTSLLVDLNTDNYVSKYTIGKRKGNPVIDFGCTLWTLTEHKAFTNEIVNSIINVIDEVANKYIEAQVWDRHDIKIIKRTINTIFIELDTFNSNGNQLNKYFIPITNINNN